MGTARDAEMAKPVMHGMFATDGRWVLTLKLRSISRKTNAVFPMFFLY